MMNKLVRFLCFCIGWVGLLLTTGLQYTHDTTHGNCSSEDHRTSHTATDDCSLCWFISHQVSPDFELDTFLPQAYVREFIGPLPSFFIENFISPAVLSRGNKDPPFLL